MPSTAPKLLCIAGVGAGMLTQGAGCWALVSLPPAPRGHFRHRGSVVSPPTASEKRGPHCATWLKAFGKAELAGG